MQNNFEPMLDSNDFSDYCVLLVEDDEIMRLSLEDRLRLENIPVHAVCDTASARKELEKGDVDLVITDIRLPDGTGIELFTDMSRRFPGIPVILMTAYGDVSDAVTLVKSGALDYLTKPFEISDFIKKVEHHLSCIADTRLTLGNSGADNNSFKAGSGHLGKSSAMRKIERLVARLGESDSSVLLTGESGVGKEVVATLIHNNSLRAQGPMVKVNCAALSSTLIESELFGHEKGAFTGATQRRIGRFEQAQGGTIFLDEIAEVSPDIQVKLLRVLQEREIERVGGVESVTLDVRVIAATQVNLDESIKNNDFRSDLYWRLNVIHVDIPPLRERPEDIVYLARLFASELVKKSGSSIKGLSKEAELQLQSMSFPGNVRELKNIIERAIALCDAPWIGARDLLTLDSNTHEISTTTLRQSIEEAERKAINKALAENHGKINQAAGSLGISRKNLWEKMKRYGIEK
ncbi:sigma-54-dependent transcriptional regulator [endosymbiont of Riftia pachyptila]|uniref:Transcriptional regulatory protein zraR n=1 Tax=endosymbiont of Riftia pachyptila (vent Ph05) TaxID=1048808 RepID=G2DGL1_9GAMM|nr:sigma-54 dependent transcriptional regulator [endosymbiont of Riftia pachyptila]EGV50251.1 transcriptional regulatory protein zraR [endosymbiont of Riftia pachyptila (vent Ph05)]